MQVLRRRVIESRSESAEIALKCGDFAESERLSLMHSSKRRFATVFTALWPALFCLDSMISTKNKDARKKPLVPGSAFVLYCFMVGACFRCRC